MNSSSTLCAALVGAATFATGCGMFSSSTSGSSATVRTSSSTSSTASNTQESVALATDPSLEGLTLRQREFAQGQNEDFQEQVAIANERCGTNIEARIDWQSFAAQIDLRLDGQLNKSFSGYCATGIDGVRSACDSDTGRAAVQQRIQQYTCHYGPERTMTLDEGHLQLNIDWEAANYGDFVGDFLGRSL